MAEEHSEAPILVPVDFSPHSAAALELGCELAAALRAPLVVLHVVHDPAEAPGYYTRALGDSTPRLRKLEDLAGEVLNNFLERFAAAHPGDPVVERLHTELVTGLPVTRILELVEKLRPRLVVMGSQGRSCLAEALLGSKAEQVVRLCPVPVVLVKQPAPLPEPPAEEAPEGTDAET